MMKIIIQNAYSTYNSGDGLLVDLTVEILQEAFGDFEILIIANDPESFSYPKVVQSKSASRNLLIRLLFSTRNLLKLLKHHFTGQIRIKEFDSEFDGTDLLVSVGGGYMRGKGVSESLKVVLNNATQLAWASSKGIPCIYMSQSVGPFCWGFLRNLVLESAARISSYYVRDNRSLDFFKELTNVTRSPDLAVLKVGHQLSKGLKFDGSYSKVYFVFRDINQPQKVKLEYYEKLSRLMNAFDVDSEIVIQSEGRGNDDRKFASDTLGIDKPLRTLKAALEDTKGVVISVRLHGAIESILNGCPAIHLSYERKGFGAYEDLGISDYVFNSSDFDLDEVVAKTKYVLNSSEHYEESLINASKKIVTSRDMLIEDVKRISGMQHVS